MRKKLSRETSKFRHCNDLLRWSMEHSRNYYYDIGKVSD